MLFGITGIDPSCMYYLGKERAITRGEERRGAAEWISADLASMSQSPR